MSTPDFDSMSPEELMAWMESLARRQGADEGFTTDTVLDVPEIDPSTVQDTGPGYIPYGMDPEVWEAKQRQEEERKAARRAAQAGSSTPAPAEPPAPAVPAAETTPPAASSAEPDFDAMSPEELMAWMETLARRQGADEGFTTDTVLDVPEIDPTTVQDTGPGYIPYGMDPEVWAEKQRQEEERKAIRRTTQTPGISSIGTPSTPPTTEPYQSPLWDDPAARTDAEPAAASAASASDADDPLAWLANLGDGDSSGGFGELDLSALGAPLDSPAAQTDDPMAWLESLSQPEASIPGLDQFSLDFGDAITSDPVTPPTAADQPSAPPSAPAPSAASTPAESDPLEWLESLARRQGVDEEELFTDANLNIPLPENANTEAGGYTEYTFETPEETPGVDPLAFLNSFDDDEYDLKMDLDEETDSDSAWLEALASGQTDAADSGDAHSDVPDTDKIMEALARNEVDPDQIGGWMGNLLDQGAARNDVSDYIDDDSEDLVEAQLPDWLIEQVGMPPATTSATDELPASLFIDEPSEAALSSLDELDALVSLETSDEEVDFDTLDLLGEFESGSEVSAQADADSYGDVPDWLKTDGGTGDEPSAVGEIPDWLNENLDAGDEGPAEDEQPAVAEMPDWLKEDLTEQDAMDFSDIFETETDSGESQTLAEILDLTENAMITSDELVMDSSDPWVEAFELERTQGLDDISQIPEWYAEKLSEIQHGPSSSADTAPAETPAPVITLAAANLPDEEELASGALQSIPAWLQSSLTSPQPLETPLPSEAVAEAAQVETAPAEAEVTAPEFAITDEADADETAASELDEALAESSGEMPDWLRDQVLETEAAATEDSEIPDWLREAGIEDVSEVPDWLTESITTEEPIVSTTPPVSPTPPVITPAAHTQPTVELAPVTPPAGTGASPSYVPAAAASIDVEETLAAARSDIREGKAEVALQNYEAVVRSNRSIEVVISDLNALLEDEQHKNNPAVYRVLGDGLMRTGQLQDALNTYRKALNML